MDTATRMDSGGTRQRIASQRRQCVTTVDNCPEQKEEESTGREKARGKTRRREKIRYGKVGDGVRKERER